MLSIFLAVFACFLLTCLLLSLSVMRGGKPLSGSCGGISAITGEAQECSICGKSGPCEKELPPTTDASNPAEDNLSGSKNEASKRISKPVMKQSSTSAKDNAFRA